MENREDRVAEDIQFPPYWMEAIYFEMERVFSIPRRETKQHLTEYFQAQYDALEDKEGVIQLNCPTVEEFIQYVWDKIKGE